MITNSLPSRYLIGSLCFHIGLFMVMKNVSPSPHSTMRTVDAFIVESYDARLSESHRAKLPAASPDAPARITAPSRLQLPHHDEITPSPSAEASPTKAAADVSELQPAYRLTPSNTAVTAAPINQSSIRSMEAPAGSMPLAPVPQNHGAVPVMTIGDIGSPRFIHREMPVYPFLARKFGKEGKVVLLLALDAHGKLQGMDTIESNGSGFADAARAAIRKSTFEPAVSNGRAIASQVLVPIRFVLN